MFHDFCLPSQKLQALTMEAPRAPSPSLEELIIFQVKLPFGGYTWVYHMIKTHSNMALSENGEYSEHPPNYSDS